MRKKKPGRRRLKANRLKERATERKCIATGAIGSPEGYVRFALSPDGFVTPDFSGKLPGRGAWVTASRESVEAAVNKNAFMRAFRCKADAPDDLAERVEAGLKKSALSALGLARKTGDAVTGFEKVRNALKTGKAAVLVEASDGSPDGKRKLAGLTGNVPVIGVFAREELSAALGQEDVVHAALKNGPAANRFLREARRFEGFGKAPEGDEKR
jgi:predicted RNA-binding protein YlxR (DUF448 family)